MIMFQKGQKFRSTGSGSIGKKKKEKEQKGKDGNDRVELCESPYVQTEIYLGNHIL